MRRSNRSRKVKLLDQQTLVTNDHLVEELGQLEVVVLGGGHRDQQVVGEPAAVEALVEDVLNRQGKQKII